MNETIAHLPPLHSAFLDRLLEEVKRDSAIEAVLAGGSLVQGGFDEYSDLDLILVMNDAAAAATAAQKRALAACFGNLLACFTGEHVGEPRLLICLYGAELLHVDLKFVVASDLNELVERPLVLWARDPAAIAAVLDNAVIGWPERSPEWFEERAWIWLHYGAAKLLRGELFEAMGMIAWFREQVLGPMLHRRSGRTQRGVRRIEEIGPGLERLRAVVADHGSESVRLALLAAIDLYLDLRTDDPPAVCTPHMPESLLAFLERGASKRPPPSQSERR